MKSKLLKSNRNIVLRITCFCILFSISIFPLFAANNDFEGEISYKITYEDGLDEPVLEVLPKQSTILIKDRKFYSFTNSPLGNQGLIYDDKKKLSYSLIDLFSTALAIKKNEADLLKDREHYKVEKIKHSNEIKMILGYSCRKVIVSVYIPKLKQIVDLQAFYTITLGNNEWINEADPIYYQVKGTLMEYEIQMGSVFMTMKATEIKHKKLSNNSFNIPETHKIVSPKEAELLLKDS